MDERETPTESRSLWEKTKVMLFFKFDFKQSEKLRHKNVPEDIAVPFSMRQEWGEPQIK